VTPDTLDTDYEYVFIHLKMLMALNNIIYL